MNGYTSSHLKTYSSSFHQGSASFIPLFQKTMTRQGKSFYSKEYLDTLKKVISELDKIEILIEKFDKSEIGKESDLLNFHNAAQLNIGQILQRSLPQKHPNKAFKNGYRFTYTIGQKISKKTTFASWPIKTSIDKYQAANSLLNKALIICPKCDVSEITRAAYFIEKCRLILPSIN